MSYQVLARKWRPRSFREMVGQEHVLKALINALDHNRLHHAYLFTGTRGVGKTTIARILAKCLNCEGGISSEPCGDCSACREIAEGRFVDLIEVDAASRTKVEDTRELLDNVQYAPTRGRYKIYLIDEVHMLSNHSFNALLKTLEEPPDHVKFLLATTDPQKLPITILSRCLQFNLKNMSPERIVQHLHHVLTEELVPYDEASLWQLARSADGSMRDALSLTDQAIAYGSGKIADADVAAMLGTIDHQFIEQLITALVSGDAAALLNAVAAFAEQSPDYHSALGDLITLLHRIAIAQALPEALDNSYGDRQQILRFAQSLASEDVQLFYQTALIGRRDLHLAPEPRGGFEMTLLRMLAFKPQGVADVPKKPLPNPAAASSHLQSNEKASTAPEPVPQPLSPVRAAMPTTEPYSPAASEASTAPLPEENLGDVNEVPPWVVDEPMGTASPKPPETGGMPGKKPEVGAATQAEGAELLAGLKTAAHISSPRAALSDQPAAVELDVVVKTLADVEPSNWIALFKAMNVRGVLQSTVANCILLGREGHHLHFALDVNKASLFDESHRQRLSDMLTDYLGETVKAHIELQALDPTLETPALYQERMRKEAKLEAVNRLNADPVMQVLQHEFAARLDLDSVTYTVKA